MYNTWTSGPNFPLRVINTDAWPFEGTGLSDGDEIDGLVGYEMDQVFDGQGGPETLLLGESPSSDQMQPYVSHMTLYQHGNSWVFGCGTNSWSWALDDSTLDFLPAFSHQVATESLQRLTRNLLGAMLAPRALAVDLAGAPRTSWCGTWSGPAPIRHSTGGPTPGMPAWSVTS